MRDINHIFSYHNGQCYILGQLQTQFLKGWNVVQNVRKNQNAVICKCFQGTAQIMFSDFIYSMKVKQQSKHKFNNSEGPDSTGQVSSKVQYLHTSLKKPYINMI